MPYPPLVNYNSIADYRKHFERVYCKRPLVAFDGIPVLFRKRDFDHAFYETVRTKDDKFSQVRAERIDWIQAALQDPNSTMYVGWDNQKKRYNQKRRVALVQGNYVVVITISGKGKGYFGTAFVANSSRTLRMIQQSPPWP
jgi:hypothetical protein